MITKSKRLLKVTCGTPTGILTLNTKYLRETNISNKIGQCAYKTEDNVLEGNMWWYKEIANYNLFMKGFSFLFVHSSILNYLDGVMEKISQIQCKLGTWKKVLQAWVSSPARSFFHPGRRAFRYTSSTSTSTSSTSTSALYPSIQVSNYKYKDKYKHKCTVSIGYYPSGCPQKGRELTPTQAQRTNKHFL